MDNRFNPIMAEFFLKNWHHFKQITRYIISGGTAAAFNLGILYLLTNYLAVWYLSSAVLAYIISFFISFFLQKLWTFRDNSTERIHKQLAIYFMIALFGLGFNTLLMYCLVDILHIWYMLAQVIIGFILAFFNFLFYRSFVFDQQIINDGKPGK